MDRFINFWTISSPGITLKPYPSVSLAHPAMTELARLISVHGLQPAQVEKLDVGANHQMTTTLLHHRAKTGLEAKLSIEFCMAILLLRGKAGASGSSDHVVRSEHVQESIGRVNLHADP